MAYMRSPRKCACRRPENFSACAPFLPEPDHFVRVSKCSARPRQESTTARLRRHGIGRLIALGRHRAQGPAPDPNTLARGFFFWGATMSHMKDAMGLRAQWKTLAESEYEFEPATG